MTIRPGLCSVTFRALTPEAVIALAAENGVAAIEWGGDVHVPRGDLARARVVATACADAAIDACSYGSYVRAGEDGARSEFDTALATATALGAGNIRVWAGRANRATAGDRAMATAAADLAYMADAAQARDITVSVEYHRNSLTERVDDTLALLGAAAARNLFTYWQPVPGRGLQQWQSELAQLAPHLGDVHVFHWITSSGSERRRPLTEGAADWRALIAAWQSAPRWPHPRRAFLEFVRNDDPNQFQDDMAQLRTLCAAG